MQERDGKREDWKKPARRSAVRSNGVGEAGVSCGSPFCILHTPRTKEQEREAKFTL